MNRSGIFFLLVMVLSCRQSTDRVDIRTNLIQLQIVDNNQGGHKDIQFQISGLTDQKIFDSYFFALALERKEKDYNLAAGVADLFEYWKAKILLAHNDEAIFLPIDFSDEYTGCVKVDKIGEAINLTYGSSRITGLNVNPINPENYYKEVSDFEAQNDKHITVSKDALIKSLDTLINELKSAR